MIYAVPMRVAEPATQTVAVRMGSSVTVTSVEFHFAATHFALHMSHANKTDVVLAKRQKTLTLIVSTVAGVGISAPMISFVKKECASLKTACLHPEMYVEMVFAVPTTRNVAQIAVVKKDSHAKKISVSRPTNVKPIKNAPMIIPVLQMSARACQKTANTNSTADVLSRINVLEKVKLRGWVTF